MKNNLFRKLKGFQKAPRDRFLLLSEKILTQEEFILYELGISLTDWDQDHTETYDSFKATNQQLADMLGWASDTTVGRYRKNLIKKGYFTDLGDGYIQVKDFEKWLSRQGKNAKLHIEAAKIQVGSANNEEKPAKMQEDQSSNTRNPLVSYKDNLSLSDDELDKILFDIDSPRIALGATPSPKTVDQLNQDEQLALCTEIFGEGTRWNNA
ncbi:MAG: hypothetical protein PHE48_00040 [Candidatus Daviesbacteria bacterium]|nr:hypothetical protein [Candidatus Daviesbacteria bacterium]